MTPTPEKLDQLLRSGDTEAVATMFASATEAQRTPLAKPVLAWCGVLEKNLRAGFNEKARQRLAPHEVVVDPYSLMPAAHAAALACASLAQIRTIEFLIVDDEVCLQVLHARRPPWRDEFAEFLCEQELGMRTADSWRTVRNLIRAGLCRSPAHDNYVLGAILGIRPKFNFHEVQRRKEQGLPPLPVPLLADLLLAERDWLDTPFWRLFEIEGNSEISLSNCEKYGNANDSWTDALVELARRGELPRARLLDASLEALSRDFIQFRAGWFSRMHEALRPTPAERAERIDAYLNLLASSIPPTVSFAMETVALADESAPQPADKLLPALAPVLAARGKAVVKRALSLLDRLAARDPDSRRDACLAAATALLHETPDVQRSVFALLEKHGDLSDAGLRERIGELQSAVVASLRRRLAPWCNEATASPPATARVAPRPAPPPARLDPARAIAPIDNFDDLIHLAAAVLESPDRPEDVERVLDGFSRLNDQRPDDFAVRTGPLRQRAEKLAGAYRNHLVAIIVLSWTTGSPLKPADDDDEARNPDLGFLDRRLVALSRQLTSRKPLPLLAAPTHQGGWIDPVTLVGRWKIWQQAGVEPDAHEQVLALLRLAPENRSSALRAAAKLSGEAGRAVRLALGGSEKTGRDAALWLAAWRARQPDGDIPEFERVHPNLGPDAGIAARVTWSAKSKKHRSRDYTWQTLDIAVETRPPCPKRIAPTLLPVLFHQRNKYESRSRFDQRWATTLWPDHDEAHFARAIGNLASAVKYYEVGDDELAGFLEPLLNPSTRAGPMALLALALGLAAEGAALRSHAQEALIAMINDGRLSPVDLGDACSRLLETGFNKLCRWAKSLGEAARVSPAHAAAVETVLQATLSRDPKKAPRDTSALLELLVELRSETGDTVLAPATRAYLSGLTTGGKTGRLVKQLLRD